VRHDAAAKNEWILKAYDRFKVDVANLSSHDLAFVSEKLSRAEFARNATAHPILNRFVSANIQNQSVNLIAPPPFIVKEISDLRDGNSKPIRVAFIGLTEQASTVAKGFKIGDPVDAAKRAVIEARKRADITVLLAHVKTETAERIAREAPGVDAIIVGNTRAEDQVFTVSFRIGNTLVAFTPYETRMIGELRFYRDNQSRFTVKDRYISLDGLVPDDTEVLEVVADANKAETDARKSAGAFFNDWLKSTRTFEGAPGAHVGSAAGYVSSAGCAECHTAQYIKWSSTAHARATGSLLLKPVDFDASCLSCHASSGLQNGVIAAGSKPMMQDVSCEQCHGPGKDHVTKPGKAYGKILNMQTACNICHTAATSPKFDLQSYWEKIKH
jgi:hypothetical protein